tara:strand:- start:360 stop:848 length:489 start_codon:yes stop_codon:yes gene_type:complete
MSKLPAQKATATDNNTGSHDNPPVTPIQAAEGAIANTPPNNRFEVHVKRFVYGYITRKHAASGARIRASVLSIAADTKKIIHETIHRTFISKTRRTPLGRCRFNVLGFLASMCLSIILFEDIPKDLAVTIAKVIQINWESVGNPSAARIIPVKANGKANTVS